MAHQGQAAGWMGKYLIHTVYRFRDAFRDPDKALGLFKNAWIARSPPAIWSAIRI